MEGKLSRGAPRFNVTPGMVVAFDFETMYDSKAHYSLRNMTPYDYVHDPRFDAYLVAFTSEDGQRFVGAPEEFDWSSLAGAHLIAHNAAFDGMVLNRLFELGKVARFEYALDCTADMVAFFCIPRSLKDACKHLLGRTLSKKVRTEMDGKTLRDLSPAAREELIAYGGSDADNCLDLWKAKSAEWPEIEREISRIGRESGWRGVRVDRAALQKGIAALKNVQAAAVANLPWVNRLNPDKGAKAGSTAAFASHCMRIGLPVPKCLNKTDPGYQAWIERYRDKYPFIQARLDAASIPSHMKRLEAMLHLADHEDVIRFSSLYFGSHCLTGGHEVLTRRGWVRLDAWTGGDIMQWHTGGSMDFLPATPNRFDNTEASMVGVDAPFIKGVMTLGHTVPLYKAGALSPVKAGDLLRMKGQLKAPISGSYSGDGRITEAQMRVLVATQADGSFAKPYGELIFTLRKPRKITRIARLLDAAGVNHKLQYFKSAPGQARITVAKRDLPDWLCRERKFFGPWLLDSTAEARVAFVDELGKWDGWTADKVTPNGVPYTIREYYSCSLENVRWAATMMHLSGKAAGRIGTRPAHGNSKESYRVVIREAATAEIIAGTGGRSHVKRMPAEGAVYCPTTQTGYFLFRYKDTIAVTGNTGRYSGGSDAETSGGAKVNIYNQPKGEPGTGLTHGVDMRGMIIPRPGYVFSIWDFSQIESRCVQWMSGNTAFLDLIRKIGNIYEADAVQSGLWDPARGSLKKADPRLYSSSKQRVLGLGFSMSCVKFLLTCKKARVDIGYVPKAEWNLDRRMKFIIRNQTALHWDRSEDEEEISRLLMADRLVMGWRAANPRIADRETGLWAWMQSQLETAAANGEATHTFTLPSGRKKTYYNPHFKFDSHVKIDPETGVASSVPRKVLMAESVKGFAEAFHGGKITENIIQATARDILFWGVVDVLRAKPNWFFPFNVYDEGVFEVPIAEAELSEKLIPDCLCRGSASSWTQGLPLEVDGGIRDRYEK